VSTIHLDFKDMSLANSFPQHGWALNSKGRKLLWLPIMNVMVNVEEVRQKRGIAELLNKTVAHADHFIQTSLQYVSASLARSTGHQANS
jgi:hypothetical protein